MRINKIIILTTLILLTVFSLNTPALVITNLNSKAVNVDIIDIYGYKQYSYPSEWRTCNVIPVIDALNGTPKVALHCFNDVYKYHNQVDFYKQFRIEKNNVININQDVFSAMPSEVAIKISGYTGSMKLDYVNSECEITVKNKGFMRGIEAEFTENCFSN